MPSYKEAWDAFVLICWCFFMYSQWRALNRFKQYRDDVDDYTDRCIRSNNVLWGYLKKLDSKLYGEYMAELKAEREAKPKLEDA